MSEVVGVDLGPLDCTSRLEALLAQGVGLWDVVAEAHRKGSLDSQIRERNDNDLGGLLSRHPNIEAIAFNGRMAGRLGLKVLEESARSYQIVELPSSSPAHTAPYVDKLRSSSPAYTLAYTKMASRWLTLQSALTEATID